MSTAPLVSIVIATYNRARVLAHAIESVRRSTLTDWELLVVGDHCTDETGEVVASCGDARITYVNLPKNTGDQSGPHNEGIRRARGRYLAFLNHDDLYFPDHLASAVGHLERTGADLVWSPLLVALPTSPEELAAGTRRFRLSGVVDGDDYDPRVFVFASAWLMTRQMATAVGPWRAPRETFVSSSQDWLFRAWRSGARLRFHPSVGVLAVPAGPRRGSYAAVESPEHDCYSVEMRDNPRFRDDALAVDRYRRRARGQSIPDGPGWVGRARRAGVSSRERVGHLARRAPVCALLRAAPRPARQPDPRVPAPHRRRDDGSSSQRTMTTACLLGK